MGNYKQMIRDRMPYVIDLALKYCKAKERWIDHVHENIVKTYPKEKRSVIVKVILGLKQQVTRMEIHDYYKYVKLLRIDRNQVNNIPKEELYMPFKNTINWQSLDTDMYNYWSSVTDWVDWFKMSYASIRDTYDHSLAFKNTEEETIQILKDKYGINDNLVNYLIKSFK